VRESFYLNRIPFQGRQKKRFTITILGLIIWFISADITAQTFDKSALLEFAKFEMNKSKKENQKSKSPVFRIPLIYESANLEAAQSVNNNQIWGGGIAGLDLSGSGILIGYWDENQPRLTHQEYSGRVSFEDSESGSNNPHATQMVGTMIATGVKSEARGMANLATVEAWNWNSDLAEMAIEAASGLLVSSHPYIETAGWTTNTNICDSENNFPTINWMWFSLESENMTKAYQFGYYDSQAQKWDSVAYLAPNYLMIKAAGNQRGEGPSSQPINHWTYDSEFNCVQDSETVREFDGGSIGFESINAASLAKNVLVVGAVESSSNNFDDRTSVIPISSSGFGPTDDGRIKPDIVAPTGVYTSNSTGDNQYTSNSGGTSAATAVVSGSITLIREHYQNLNSDTLSSASIRALLAQTADDVGNEGPDYKTGWGLLNTERAVRFLSTQNSNSSSTILKDTLLVDGNTISFDFEHTSNRPLIITIAWTDPAGTPSNSGDDPTDTLLVNDLDLSVIDPSLGSHQPWILDKSNPSNVATTGDNELDNIEQIVISEAESGTYSVTVSHKESLQSGSQKVSILVSETEPEIEIETIASGNWSEASTWSGGTTPSTSLHSASLNHAITLDEDAIVRGVTFTGASAELILNGNSVTLNGGVFHTSGGLGFSGDTAAAIKIYDWDLGSDSLRFKNGFQKLDSLTISTDGDSIRLGSSLSIYSKLSLESGILDVRSKTMKLISDTSKTAWFEKTSGSLVGDFTYSRLFSQESSGWRMISSPVQSQLFSTLSDSFHTQGGAWSDFSVSESESSLWLYDGETQNFSGYVGADTSFTSGEGYLMYIFDDAPGGTKLPTYLNLNGSEPDSIIMNLVRGEDDASSYNLAGNPFASAIDWHEIVNNGTNLGTSYAVWDPEGNSAGGTSGFKYYNSADGIGDAGRYIAPMQGLFVQANDESSVLRFRQSQKTGSQPNKYGKLTSTKPVFIRFSLLDTDRNVLDNQAHLIFSESASKEQDVHDVLRIESLIGIQNQVSFSGADGELRVFEGRSSEVETDVIGVKQEISKAGLYILNWDDWNRIPESWEMEFMDHANGLVIDMRLASEYEFYSENEASDRFSIRVKRALQNTIGNQERPFEYKLNQNYPNPFNPVTTITYSLKKGGNVKIEVFNTLGQKVATLINEQQNAGKQVVQFDASQFSSGVYFYKIEAGSFNQIRSMVLIK
tara:strand:- start:20479 stop:24090 length:3612 start_codon:yes stop_codon:yes gene_type:complete